MQHGNQVNMDPIPTLKILTLGDASVGKTSILLRFAENEFAQTSMPTIGIEYKTKEIQLNGRAVKLQVWDTAGQERYHKTLASTFYKRANGIVLVFDLTDKTTFDHVGSWVQQIKLKSDPKVAVVLVGNKRDLVDIGDFMEAKRFAEQNSLPFYTVSAKTGENIAQVFQYLSEIIANKDPSVFNTKTNMTVLSSVPVHEKDKCCDIF